MSNSTLMWSLNELHIQTVDAFSCRRRGLLIHYVWWQWRLHLRCLWLLQPPHHVQHGPPPLRHSLPPSVGTPCFAVSAIGGAGGHIGAARRSPGSAGQSSDTASVVPAYVPAYGRVPGIPTGIRLPDPDSSADVWCDLPGLDGRRGALLPPGDAPVSRCEQPTGRDRNG